MVGKEFPAFPSHLKRRRSPQERREELHGSTTIPRVPQIFQSIPEEPVFLHCFDFHAEDRLTPRWHVGPPCGKAWWEGLVGKPRGKATDPLIHATRSVTLQLQLWRKAHVHALIRDENLLHWGVSRNTPRSLSALERNPLVPAPRSEEHTSELQSPEVISYAVFACPGISGRGIPRGPRGTRMGTGLS